MSICRTIPPEKTSDNDCHCEVYPYKTQVQKPYNYGDMYVLGQLWIEALKTVLLGTRASVSKIELMPKVCAAKEEPPEPSKPPLMRYSDLPLHETPHMDYNDHLNCGASCPDANRKMLQEYLLPSVSAKRADIQKTICGIQKELKDTYTEVSTDLCSAVQDFKTYIRHPDRDQIKPIVVGLGGLTGFALAKRGLPGKVFYTTLGVLAGGFLCYPQETDVYLRTFLFNAAKVAIEVYNKVSGGGMELKGKIPCGSDLPAPVAKYAGQCVKK